MKTIIKMFYENRMNYDIMKKKLLIKFLNNQIYSEKK